MKKYAIFTVIVFCLMNSGCAISIDNCSIFGHSNNPMQEAELARLGHCNDLAKKLLNPEFKEEDPKERESWNRICN